jgi:hypothetical protein
MRMLVRRFHSTMPVDVLIYDLLIAEVLSPCAKLDQIGTAQTVGETPLHLSWPRSLALKLMESKMWSWLSWQLNTAPSCRVRRSGLRPSHVLNHDPPLFLWTDACCSRLAQPLSIFVRSHKPAFSQLHFSLFGRSDGGSQSQVSKENCSSPGSISNFSHTMYIQMFLTVLTDECTYGRCDSSPSLTEIDMELTVSATISTKRAVRLAFCRLFTGQKRHGIDLSSLGNLNEWRYAAVDRIPSSYQRVRCVNKLLKPPLAC